MRRFRRRLPHSGSPRTLTAAALVLLLRSGAGEAERSQASGSGGLSSSRPSLGSHQRHRRRLLPNAGLGIIQRGGIGGTMERMRAITENQIHAALGRLKAGLERYLWLQCHVGLCDVGKDEQFQTRFNGFYRVRRGLSWRSDYFALMESAKKTGIEFSGALKEINRRTGRVEASFASKLVATLNPSTPVIDRFVLESFELKLPRWGSPDRESKIVDLYCALCHGYEDFLSGTTGALMRDLFDRRFPKSGVTELKKIDLVLWQIRP